MYEAFFGLRNRPFSPLPRVETFVPVAPLREPLTSLIRCIEQDQGIGVLTSPAGAGKSLLCRILFHHFREMRRTVLLTTARFPTRRALLQAILFELKHPYVGLSEQEARLRILDLLHASPVPMQRMLLIVDEAHLLSSKGLEELRTLTDYEVDGVPAISLILAGQLELEELLTESSMSALNQRVGCHVCLEPLTFEESGQYIRERLRFAGSDGLNVFTPEAIQLICSASEGNPRRINQLCDHSLLLAFAEETRPVNEAVVRSALLDLRELPLHWNAPLDLMGGDAPNPLEEFVQTLDSDTIAFHEGPLSDTDTELDLDDESGNQIVASEPAETPELDTAQPTVFEVGGPAEEHPIDQLFQVEKFVVPTEYRNNSDLPDLQDELPRNDSGETYSFEPPAAWEASTESPTQPSAHPVDTELPGKGLEYGGELVLGSTAPAPSPLSPETLAHTACSAQTGTARPMGFEELVIDDTYAVIDRMCETHISVPASKSKHTVNVVTSQSQRPEVSAVSQNHSCCQPSHTGTIDLDDTQFLDFDIPEGASVSHDIGPSVTPTQSALLETQLLDFINEISKDVRQFREELNTIQVEDTLAGTLEHTQQEVDRLRQQSLRRAMLAQYDVVEPESITDTIDTPAEVTVIHDTTTVEPLAVEPQWTETDLSESIAAAPPQQQAICEEKGRYAQLFTRLQRQRRRMETVMKLNRNSGN